jgi:hypothetical protein
MEGIKIDGNVFYRRLEKIYNAWKSEEVKSKIIIQNKIKKFLKI